MLPFYYKRFSLKKLTSLFYPFCCIMLLTICCPAIVCPAGRRVVSTALAFKCPNTLAVYASFYFSSIVKMAIKIAAVVQITAAIFIVLLMKLASYLAG